MKFKPRARALFLFSGLLLVAAAAGALNYLVRPSGTGEADPDGYFSDHRQLVSKEEIADALKGNGVFHDFPSEIDLSVEGKQEKAVVQYAFDPKLQESMENLFSIYRPDYGSFVALDAATGRILSMVSYSHRKDIDEHLALRATFPSASVFKVVTAAAAIAVRSFSANTVIPFNGRNHTLYRSHILKTRINRWTRYITLKEAFARSVNTVFARIGAFNVGAEEMRDYAGRFGFNRTIASDVPFQQGRAVITDDPWNLAETASGFTKESTMSPLQGALIAAAVVNNGVMMEPYAVNSVHRGDGTQLYRAFPKVAGQSLDSATAEEVRVLMRETVRRGTSRGSFRGFSRSRFSFVDVGGKTGSLSGLDPRGKYDWFVGYAEYGGQKIALAALTVHEKYWRVKSSYLARRSIETYFKDRLGVTARVEHRR